MTDRAPDASNWGSLRWWKDDDDAVFPGTGEVSIGRWRDGSALPCSTCAPCFHTDLPTYNQVSVRFGLTGAFHTMTHGSGDFWSVSLTGPGTGPPTILLSTDCGLSVAGCQGLKLQVTSGGGGPGKLAFFQGVSAHLYTYWTEPDGPYPGGYVQILIAAVVLTPSFRQLGQTSASNVNSLTASFPVATLAGNALIAIAHQFGVTTSGTPLGTVTVSSGFTLNSAGSNKRIFSAQKTGAASVSGVTVGFPSTPDNCCLQIFEINTPGGVTISQITLQELAGPLLFPNVGTPTTPGVAGMLIATCCVFRQASTPPPIPTLTDPSISGASHCVSRTAADGTNPPSNMFRCNGLIAPWSSSTPMNTTFTSSISEQYNGIVMFIH